MYMDSHCISSVSFLQATRHARRVYVGGLPPMANEQVILLAFGFVYLLIIAFLSTNVNQVFESY